MTHIVSTTGDCNILTCISVYAEDSCNQWQQGKC